MIKFHPAQSHPESIKRLSEIFQASMEKRGILPKNPWKAKRLETWIEGMGGRFHAGSSNVRFYRVDPANFVNFKVDCPQPSPTTRTTPMGHRVRAKVPPRIKGRREHRYVHIEIPWELADKVLVLGYLP